MKNKMLKKLTIITVICVLVFGAGAVFSDKKTEESEDMEDIVELVWYQPGERKKDTDIVLEKVNDYLAEKKGVKLDIVNVEGTD